jgi:hypothetical protein
MCGLLLLLADSFEVSSERGGAYRWKSEAVDPSGTCRQRGSASRMKATIR